MYIVISCGLVSQIFVVLVFNLFQMFSADESLVFTANPLLFDIKLKQPLRSSSAHRDASGTKRQCNFLYYKFFPSHSLRNITTGLFAPNSKNIRKMYKHYFIKADSYLLRRRICILYGKWCRGLTQLHDMSMDIIWLKQAISMTMGSCVNVLLYLQENRPPCFDSEVFFQCRPIQYFVVVWYNKPFDRNSILANFPNKPTRVLLSVLTLVKIVSQKGAKILSKYTT